jgi:threonine dehydratase
METAAEGLATRVPFALSMSVLAGDGGLADFVLVEDADLEAAMGRLLAEEHVLVEAAGAASLAGLEAYGDAVEGSTVVLQLSGRNVSAADLRELVGGI